MSDSAPEGASYRSLTGQRSFASIYQASAKVRVGGVTVRMAPGDPGIPQVGIVAGKRVGGAVQRNRAKRRLRAALRQQSLRRDTTYVVTADSSVLTVPFGRLCGQLEDAIESVHGRVDATASAVLETVTVKEEQ